jgi:hypothetical protein
VCEFKTIPVACLFAFGGEYFNWLSYAFFMRKTMVIAVIAALASSLLSSQTSYANEKLGNPFDVKVAAAKQGQFGVPINVAAGLTIKKVKGKRVSTYHPINVTIADFKVHDTEFEYRGETVGFVPRYSYTVTIKNFSKSQEVVGVYTQLWCKNSGNYAGNYSEGFDSASSLPMRTENSGSTIVRLPQDINSLATCEQALIYIFPNFSFTAAQTKSAKFPTTVVIPIDLSKLSK